MYFLKQSFKDKNVLQNFWVDMKLRFKNLKLGKVEFYVLHHPVNI